MPPEGNLKTETPTQEPPQDSPATSPLKQIRTFQGDVAGALEKQKESLFSIQQVEQLKRASGGSVPDTSVDDSGKRKEFFFLILGSIALMALGSLGAWYGYQEYLRKTAPPTIITPDNRFISTQQSTEIDTMGISRDALLAKITEESSGLNPNELKHLILRKGAGVNAPLMSTGEFLQALEAQAPGGLVRAFDPLFMLGSLGGKGFILIKLASFENAFAGMLSWEKTLGQDLTALFSTNTELQNVEPNAVFKDVITKNKDVRVLSTSGTSTQPVLLYSFFNNKILIITESLETLQTLIDRLTQALLVH